MNRNTLLLLVGMAIMPGGCTMAPKYARPAPPIPANWPSGPAYEQSQASTNAPTAPDLGWRKFFTDEKLLQVIGTALTNNRDLRLAALNVERARAIYGIQRAELLPTVNATGNGSRQRVPANLSSTGSRQTVEVYDANLGVLAWEIDFFGRLRSLKNQALEEYLATQQARRSAQILLVSAVANAYLALAADRENLALSETTFQTQKAAYELVRRQYEVGVVTKLDLCQAQTLMETARRDIARYTQLVAQDENALTLLAGAPVSSELLPTELGRVSPPKEISPGTSSEVLLRRPDVLQAEANLHAASAQIGIATANRLPNITLTADTGSTALALDRVFTSGTGFRAMGVAQDGVFVHIENTPSTNSICIVFIVSSRL